MTTHSGHAPHRIPRQPEGERCTRISALSVWTQSSRTVEQGAWVPCRIACLCLGNSPHFQFTFPAAPFRSSSHLPTASLTPTRTRRYPVTLQAGLAGAATAARHSWLATGTTRGLPVLPQTGQGEKALIIQSPSYPADPTYTQPSRVLLLFLARFLLPTTTHLGHC